MNSAWIIISSQGFFVDKKFNLTYHYLTSYNRERRSSLETNHPFWNMSTGLGLKVQTELPKVTRWKLHQGVGKGVRLQNNLQHSFSINLNGFVGWELLKPYNPELDGELLMTAFPFHDLGEMAINEDTPFIHKSGKQDVKEYEGFLEEIKDLPEKVHFRFKQAFLLQFVYSKNRKLFPDEAQTILQNLWLIRGNEALIFEALERADYILYALEQYRLRGNVIILVQILRNHMDEMEHYCHNILGFREEIWTDEVRLAARMLLKKHEGEFLIEGKV